MFINYFYDLFTIWYYPIILLNIIYDDIIYMTCGKSFLHIDLHKAVLSNLIVDELPPNILHGIVLISFCLVVFLIFFTLHMYLSSGFQILIIISLYCLDHIHKSLKRHIGAL